MKSIYLDSCDSTNTYLKSNYQDFDNLTFVSCGFQTKGKGRNNREWFSENNKNLLFSLLIKDKSLIYRFKDISIVIAYSVIEVLREYQISNLSLKWPNDVYVNNKKICGVLLESVSIDEVKCLIVGVGLNVNQSKFENTLNHPATSISKEINAEIDIEELKTRVYQKILDNLDKIINNYDFQSQIKKIDYLKDKEVYAIINNEKQKIKVIGIDNDYSLTIEYKGQKQNIESGEITFSM